MDSKLRLTECRLTAAHVKKALNIGHSGVESLVRVFQDDTKRLLISGEDTDAQTLEEQRQTLSELRRLIQELAQQLEPLDGYLD